MSAVLLVGQDETDAIKPVAKEYLLTKVPNFFARDYRFETEPSKRVWIRVDEKTFVERFPSGKENRFTVLGRANTGEVEGIIVPLADSRLQAFCSRQGRRPDAILRKGNRGRTVAVHGGDAEGRVNPVRLPVPSTVSPAESPEPETYNGSAPTLRERGLGQPPAGPNRAT